MGTTSRLASPIVDAGQHDAQLARGEVRAGAAAVEGRGHPDGAREAAEAALDEVEVAGAGRGRRQLLSRDEHARPP